MKTYLNFRNNLTMLYKNLPERDLHSVMRLRTLLDWVAALQALLQKRCWGDFKAILKARRDFHKWKHEFDNDRQAIIKLQSDMPSDGRKSYSILWQYYVHGRKTYNEIDK